MDSSVFVGPFCATIFFSALGHTVGSEGDSLGPKRVPCRGVGLTFANARSDFVSFNCPISSELAPGVQ